MGAIQSLMTAHRIGLDLPADEVGRQRARKDPCARTRAARLARQGAGAAHAAQGVHAPTRRQFLAREMARHRTGEVAAHHGRLPRPAGRSRLPVLPRDRADRALRLRPDLHVPVLWAGHAGHHEDRRRDCRRLSRPQGAGTVLEEQDFEAPGLDAPFLSRRSRWRGSSR